MTRDANYRDFHKRAAPTWVCESESAFLMASVESLWSSQRVSQGAVGALHRGSVWFGTG